MSTANLRKNKKPVPCNDPSEWAKLFDSIDRRVALTTIVNDKSEIQVSTVFLGIDHGFGDGPPILFETMAFENGEDKLVQRYLTWEDAEKGHKRMVKQIKKMIRENKEIDEL